METKIEINKTIIFEDSSLRPEELIGFSEKYLNNLPFLNYTLRENEGKIMDIIIARINDDGFVKKVKIQGRLLEINENNFSLISNEDFFSKYDYDRTLLIHFNNVLGDVPMLYSFMEINPFVINSGTFFKYIKKLSEMKKILKRSIKTTHGARLLLNYLDRTITIECQILNVNRSNFEILQFRSIDSNGAIDLIPRLRFIKFITPKFYLSGVDISDIEIKVSPYDDDEC